MNADREHEVMSRIERAKAQLIGTGELSERVGGGRAPSRSDAFKEASAEIHAAEQGRNRLLVDLVGDADAVPLDLAKRLGLTGREAAHIIDTARNGTARMRAHVFGGVTAQP
jgi:ClpP class serine protease